MTAQLMRKERRIRGNRLKPGLLLTRGTWKLRFSRWEETTDFYVGADLPHCNGARWLPHWLAATPAHRRGSSRTAALARRRTHAPP